MNSLEDAEDEARSPHNPAISRDHRPLTPFASRRNGAMNTAQALGADGVIEAVATPQERLDELSGVLARAGTVAEDVMTAAQAAKT